LISGTPAILRFKLFEIEADDLSVCVFRQVDGCDCSLKVRENIYLFIIVVHVSCTTGIRGKVWTVLQVGQITS
jgi:hypothetical protein